MRNKIIAFLFSLIFPVFVYGGSTVDIYTDDVNDGSKVAVIFDNFRRLDAGKLDIKPGNIIPKRDSTYTVGSSGNEFLGIYTDNIYGNFNIPALSAARAYRAASVTNGIGTSATKVSLSSETYDLQGEFDSTTNFRFVATLAGTYNVKGQVESTGMGAANIKFFVYIYKNGVQNTKATCQSGGTSDLSCPVTDSIQLAVSDYIELYTQTSAAAAKDLTGGSGSTFLIVEKIR